MNPNEQTAKAFLALRNELELSQQGFADLLGKSKSTYNQWEHGRRLPDFNTLFNIFQKTGYWLMPENGLTFKKLSEMKKEKFYLSVNGSDATEVTEKTIGKVYNDLSGITKNSLIDTTPPYYWVIQDENGCILGEGEDIHPSDNELKNYLKPGIYQD